LPCDIFYIYGYKENGGAMSLDDALNYEVNRSRKELAEAALAEQKREAEEQKKKQEQNSK
jgi:hypothetical protein